MAKGTAAEVFKPGNHASTFGGNPLACAAALETLAVIEDEHLLEHATELGDFLRNHFRQRLSDVSKVVQIRGQGLIVGIELSVPCVDLVKKALEKKLLINVTSEKVVRLLPAFVMQQNEAEQVVDITCLLIKEFLNS